MAQYWLDIHTDPRSDAEILALFQLINCTSEFSVHSMSVVTKDGLRALRIGRSYGTTVAMARFIEAGSSSSTVDVVARMEVESVSTTAPGGLVCRATAVASSTAQWYCGYSTGAGSIIGRQDNAGSYPTTLATGSSGVDQTQYHYRRLLVSGSSLSQKVWAGARGDEPGSWLLTATDSTYSGGVIGIGSRGGASNQGIVHLTQLAIGTDGDPAPTGPIGGRQRSRLILTPW